MKRNNNKGFTLAELLIVVAVIAVLVAVAIPTFTGQLEKSRQSVDVSNMRAAYAQAKLLVLNQDDENSPFKDALDFVKKGKTLTDQYKTYYFWYNKEDNTLESETELAKAANNVFDENGALLGDNADKYQVGKALTTELIANTSDFAENKITYTNKGTEDAPATLPTVNKGIVVKIVYDETTDSATYQTFVLDDITFSDKKASKIPATESIDVKAKTGSSLPSSFVHGQKIKNSDFTVTATYVDGTTAVVDTYKFGYSKANDKQREDQLIGEFNNDEPIPATDVPVDSYIYVTYGGKIKILNDNVGAVVKAGIQNMALTTKGSGEGDADATLTYTYGNALGFTATNATATGSTDGETNKDGKLYTITMTDGNTEYVAANDAKLKFKVTYSPDLKTENLGDTDLDWINVTPGTDTLTKNMTLYAVYNDAFVLKIGKITTAYSG